MCPQDQAYRKPRQDPLLVSGTQGQPRTENGQGGKVGSVWEERELGSQAVVNAMGVDEITQEEEKSMHPELCTLRPDGQR